MELELFKLLTQANKFNGASVAKPVLQNMVTVISIPLKCNICQGNIVI